MAEIEIIKYLRSKFPKKNKEIRVGIGDDGMIMKNNTVISTDSFAQGIHFDLKYFSMFALGCRTMGASLSDLAAMAAEPICALISLGLPRSTKTLQIKELYRGFAYVCNQFHCDISGGDIIESPILTITITVVGKTRSPLMRSGAKPGDYLYTTGYLGLAEVGRIVLKEGYRRNQFPEAVKKHLYPEPRIYEAQRLRKYLSAGIDTSDGLSTDAHHLAEESCVRVLIEEIPIHPEVALLCSFKKISPIKFVLSAGEDFELLVAGKILYNLRNIKLFKIGRILEGKGVYLLRNKTLKRIYPTG
ncbi:MAG: thiamine-phosphate kinase, partial [candidate division WOR-3 bacterium]